MPTKTVNLSSLSEQELLEEFASELARRRAAQAPGEDMSAMELALGKGVSGRVSDDLREGCQTICTRRGVGTSPLTPSLGRAHHGSRSIDMNALSPGVLNTALNNLEPGIYYAVRFWMAGNPQCAPAVKQLRVEIGHSGSISSYDFTFDSTGRTITDMGWMDYGFAFIPQSTSVSLTFRSLTSGACGPVIDYVRLIAT